MLRDRHVWADDDYDLAWTVAVLQGIDVETVLTVYGGSASSTRLGKLTFAEAMHDRNEHFDDHAVLQLLVHERYVVAMEPNGWIGNLPRIAQRTSRGGGSFFSVYWSPSASRIVQARDGQVTANFDPNFIGLPAGTGDLLPGWVGDNDFPLEHLKSSCLAAMEQQTGMAFDRAWLQRKLPTYRIPPPLTAVDIVLRESESDLGAMPDIDELLDSGQQASDTDQTRRASDPVDGGPLEPGHGLFGI